MAHYIDVMLGTIGKLQSDLSGGSLPQRPLGGLDTGSMLGACVMERRTVVSEFRIHNFTCAFITKEKKFIF